MPFFLVSYNIYDRETLNILIDKYSVIRYIHLYGHTHSQHGNNTCFQQYFIFIRVHIVLFNVRNSH